MKNFSLKTMGLLALVLVVVGASKTFAAASLSIINNTSDEIPYALVAGDENQKPNNDVASDVIAPHRKVIVPLTQADVYKSPYLLDIGQKPFYELSVGDSGLLKISMAADQIKSKASKILDLQAQALELRHPDDKPGRKYVGNAKVMRIIRMEDGSMYELQAERSQDGSVAVTISAAK